jgi:transposase InsO family protein
MPAPSLAGVSRAPPTRASSWTRWSRRFTNSVPSARLASSITRTADRSSSASAIPSGSRRQASDRLGSVGDSYDNALAETINGLYKAEVIHRRGPWRSFEAVEFATLEWVDWFNHRRLLERIGNIPPTEAEERSYAMLDEQKLAA